MTTQYDGREGNNDNNNPDHAFTFLVGEGALLIWTNDNTQFFGDEAELNRWWTNEYLPERLACTGFMRARRYYARNENYGDESPRDSTGIGTAEDPVEETPGGGFGGFNPRESDAPKPPPPSHYLVWYEVTHPSVLRSQDYLNAMNRPSAATRANLPRPMDRSACKILYSFVRGDFARCRGNGVGSTLAHIVFEPPSTEEGRVGLREAIEAMFSRGIEQGRMYDTLMAFHLLEHDAALTRASNDTASYHPEGEDYEPDMEVDREKWNILLDFSEPMGAGFARHPEVTQEVVRYLEERLEEMVSYRVYELICAMSDMPVDGGGRHF